MTIGEQLDVLLTEIEDPELRAHFDVLAHAMAIHATRREQYGDNWRRQGWRGGLFKLRLKVERAWEFWWAAEPAPQLQNKDVDDLIDAINCAVFAVRAIREDNRDGSWSYPQ